MDIEEYWKQKHRKYQDQDWINKPSIFATQCLKHFPKTGNLLELGAGQGQDSRFFAQKRYQVTSTDFSPDALQISKEKAQNKYPDLQFQKLDFSKTLPFTNGSFDIVYSHLGLHYFNQKNTQKLFLEIHRALKPHGIFASLLNTLDDPEVKESTKIEENYYQAPDNLMKSYFSTSYLTKLTKSIFKPILLDNRGTTHKDETRTLIRFIGKKI